MKKIIAVFLSVLMSFALATSLVGCSAPQKVATSQVSLDVNPEIELVLDQNNKVMSIKCENEDARVLLYNEVSLEGMDYKAAVEKIVNLAVEYGYLDSENTVVNTRVSSENALIEAEILGQVNAKVVATADALSLTVTTTDELPFSLLREYEKYVAQNPDAQIDQSDFAFAYETAQELGIDVESAINESKANLVKKAHDAFDKVSIYMDEAYLKAKALAENAFDMAYSNAVDGLYATYYTTHRLTSPSTLYYGIAYQTYKVAGTSLQSGARLLETATTYAQNALNDQTVSDLVQSINEAQNIISDVTVLEDGNGNVTLDTINAFVDKYYKNLDESEKAEFKAKFTTVMNSVTDTVNQIITQNVQPIIEEVESALGSLKDKFDSFVGKEYMTGFTTTFQKFNDVLTSLSQDVTNKQVTAQKLRDYADQMIDEADEMLAKINADLSEQEKTEVEGMRRNVENTINLAKQTLNSALDSAYQSASNYLANLKSKISE